MLCLNFIISNDAENVQADTSKLHYCKCLDSYMYTNSPISVLQFIDRQFQTPTELMPGLT